jgi:hypothetical protein
MKHPVPFFDVGNSNIKDTQEIDPVSASLWIIVFIGCYL